MIATALLVSSESPLERGDQLRARRDYRGAIIAYQEAVGAGDMVALYRLASLRSNGLGMREDSNRATEEFRKAAEAGVPQAMERMAHIVWNRRVRPAVGSGDMHLGEPEQPDPPAAMEALTWLQRAADTWLATGKPYEAVQILWRLRRVDGAWYRLYPFSRLHATAAVAKKLERNLAMIAVDRPAIIGDLLALEPEDSIPIESLKALLLPPAIPLLLSDRDRYGLIATLARIPHEGSGLGQRGEPMALVARRLGQGGLCGTGRTPGGVTSPDLGQVPLVDLVVACDGEGIPRYTYRSGRESALLVDADGDGVTSELLIYDNAYDYNRPPFLSIRDLSADGAPLMLRLLFDTDPGRSSRIITGDDDQSITARIAWRFVPGTRGRQDLLLTWSMAEDTDSCLIPYDSDLRRWLPPPAQEGAPWREIRSSGTSPEAHP